MNFSIPNRAIFIWLGKRLPWSAGAAIISVEKIQQPEEIWLLAHPTELEGEGWEMIRKIPGLKVFPADISWFSGIEGGDIAASLYSQLTSPASRANLLRLAVLLRSGGVYLDTDIIAVRPWHDLLKMRGFCGLEPLALPAQLFCGWGRMGWPLALARLALREAAAQLPGGWRWFRKFESVYTMAANNAVLGVSKENPILQLAFTTIAAMPEAQRVRRFRLGTHLLQKLTKNQSSTQMELLPAPYFYPLGPEISNHWFRPATAACLDRMLLPQTRLVHWYNSVEKRYLGQELDSAWICRHQDTAFAELWRRVQGI